MALNSALRVEQHVSLLFDWATSEASPRNPALKVLRLVPVNGHALLIERIDALRMHSRQECHLCRLREARPISEGPRCYAREL
jgi:hypothetical protein